MKPGYKTTEFWLAAAAQLIPLLVLFGVLTGEEAATLDNSLGEAVATVGALVVAVSPVWKYIESRANMKAAMNGGGFGKPLAPKK